MDPRLALAGLAGGFGVGLTGMGGGAILTPILVLFLRIPPAAAVGSDLMASLAMKPVAGGVHAKARTIRWDIVAWLCAGSVPGALVGSVLSSHMSKTTLEHVMAVTLLAAAIAMVVRAVQRHRSAVRASAGGSTVAGGSGVRGGSGVAVAVSRPGVRVLPTVLVGLIGGTLVGITSVGSGSLMVVTIALLYPDLPAAVLVGTDLAQAIPLVAAATLGHLAFGDVRFGLTGALLVGAMPGAYLGARLSARPGNRYVRPALVTLLFASGFRLLTA